MDRIRKKSVRTAKVEMKLKQQQNKYKKSSGEFEYSPDDLRMLVSAHKNRQ